MRLFKTLLLSIMILVIIITSGIFQPLSILEKGQAAAVKSVIINEIAWMGTTVDFNNEWIELYNNTSSPVSLQGWKLEAMDGTPSIPLSGTISPNGYFLLEKGSDNTVPGIPANLIYNNYNNTLVNSGEVLYLKDSAGTIIDQVGTNVGTQLNPQASSWYNGDNDMKATMERIDSSTDGTVSSNWGLATTSYNGGLGTPSEINSNTFRRIIASPTQLSERTLNGNVISLTLQADTYKTEVVSKIQLNNPPPGTTIRNVKRYNDNTVHVTLNFNGTDFDRDYTDFNITVLNEGLVGTGNLTSNKMVVQAIEELEGLQTYVSTGTSYPTLIEMTGYNTRDKKLHLNSTLHTQVDVTGKTATFHYFIKVYDGESNTIGKMGDLTTPVSITAAPGANNVELNNIEVLLSQGLPAAYRIVIVVERVELN
ncbi:lamin tail domain-containing protein [Bacillus sp. SCS-153A]|uniref:lamin tail domain-containing protein n=1 Tax=Rossellomorea sedimentorum TaxID=3115294 RepID=UPI00390576AD